MHDLLRRARAGEWGAYGRFLATLLVSLGLTLYALLQFPLSGCGPVSTEPRPTATPVAQCQAEAQDTTRVTLAQKPFYASIYGLRQQAVQGEWQSLYMAAAHQDLPAAARVTFRYTPPSGITDLTFPGNPPANPQGPPPYVFNNVSATGGGQNGAWWHTTSIQVNYRWPMLAAGQTDLALTQRLVVDVDGRGSNELICTTLIRGASWQVTPNAAPAAFAAPDLAAVADGGPEPGATPEPPQLAASADPAAPAPSAQTVASVLSQQIRWDMPLTTARCQELADLLQGGRFFLALRLPTDIISATEQTLPLVFAAEAKPALVMKDTSRQYFTLPLAYRPQQAGFMARHLPSAAHTAWVALGAVALPAITCPSNVNRGPGWEFRLNLPLDVGTQPREIQCYYCYEGQSDPFASLWQQAATSLAGGGIGAPQVRAEGVTCLGPYPLRVNSGFPVQLMGAKAALDVRPGERVSFVHGLALTINSTVRIEHSSTLDVTWRVYTGTWDAPFTRPAPELIFGPSGRVTPLWVISDPVPVGASGPYALAITTTATYQGGTSQSWTTDSLWVGDWAAPPKQWDVSVPLVLRPRR
jgi:hypothetical protein